MHRWLWLRIYDIILVAGIIAAVWAFHPSWGYFVTEDESNYPTSEEDKSCCVLDPAGLHHTHEDDEDEVDMECQNG